MSFFSSDTAERPPLRHIDLEALSDRELEALLFEGNLPGRQKPWISRGTIWKGAGIAALLLVGFVVITEGLPGMLLIGLVVAVALLCGTSKCSLPKRLTRASANGDQLTRSSSNRKLMGVCGGLAAYFDLDPAIVRLVFILGLIITGGPPMALAYVLLAYVLPSASSVTAEERLRIIRES